VHRQFREEYCISIHEHTRLHASIGNYNRREDTTNCVDHGEIQIINNRVNREFNSKHTYIHMGVERTRLYYARREYST
jgi:hypothetical protein